jgi:hypothetical protein
MPAETEVNMLFKSKTPRKDKNAAGNAAEVMRRAVHKLNARSLNTPRRGR